MPSEREDGRSRYTDPSLLGFLLTTENPQTDGSKKPDSGCVTDCVT